MHHTKRTWRDGKRERFREICEIAAIFVPPLTRANYRSARRDNRVLRLSSTSRSLKESTKERHPSVLKDEERRTEDDK